jgi:hypothetical protein
MSSQSLPPDQSRLPGWPPNAAPYYRPTLFVAVAASAGVVVGSIAPWMHVVLFGDVGGLDVQSWGLATLILGAASGVALFTLLFWGSTPFNPRRAVPLAWGVALAGVVCLTDAVMNIVRIMTLEKPEIFGVTIGHGLDGDFGFSCSPLPCWPSRRS